MVKKYNITIAPGPPIIVVSSGLTAEKVNIRFAPFNNGDISQIDEYKFWYYQDGRESIILENTSFIDTTSTFTTVKGRVRNYYTTLLIFCGSL